MPDTHSRQKRLSDLLGCELQRVACGCWEPFPGSLQEHQVLKPLSHLSNSFLVLVLQPRTVLSPRRQFPMNDTDTFNNYQCLRSLLTWACSQLAPITQINPFYTNPPSAVWLTTSSGSLHNRLHMAGEIPACESFPVFLSLPGSPAHPLLPNHWQFSSRLNQSENALGGRGRTTETHLHPVYGKILAMEPFPPPTKRKQNNSSNHSRFFFIPTS